MATIKSYTDLQQSKKLAEILPLESADMYFEKGIGDNYKEAFGNYADMRITENMLGIKTIPYWSLAALLDVLPEGTILLKATNISSVGDTKYHCDCPKGNIDEWFDNPVDVCYEMILKLHELKML